MGKLEEVLKIMETVTASEDEKKKMKIWSHRGLSMNFPENTLISFTAAAEIPGNTGIELDVQRTSDGELVVFHDEKIDRVMNATGYIKDHTLSELQSYEFKKDADAPKRRAELSANRPEIAALYKKMIGNAVGAEWSELSDLPADAPERKYEEYDLHVRPFIPTMRQVLSAMKPYCDKDFKINIELKTSNVRYEGIEKEVYDLVNEFGLQKSIVYSSFLADSIKIMKELDPSLETAMLADTLPNTIKLGDDEDPVKKCDGYHPHIAGVYGTEKLRTPGMIIRAWNMEEPLYNSGKKLGSLDYRNFVSWGVTDVIINTAERYLLK